MISYLIKSQELIENYDDTDIEINNTFNISSNEKSQILSFYQDINNMNGTPLFYHSANFLSLNLYNTTSLMIKTDSSNILPYNQDCLKQDQIELNTTNFLIKLTNHMLIIFPWIMIIVGSISNIISFVVLTRPKLRKSSTFFYLSCLCVIDLLFLFTVCGNMIFLYHFEIDLQAKSLIICKLYSFLIYFLPQFSAWTCAAVSLDRVVSVIFSVRGKHTAAAKRFNTPQKALRVELIIFFCLFLLNVQFFFYPNEFEFQKDQLQDINIMYCSPENIPRYETFYTFWVYIDLSVNVLIPFFIMIISSIIIIVGVFKSTKNMTNRGNTHKDTKKSVTINSKNRKQNNESNGQHNNETNTFRLREHQQPLLALNKNDTSGLKQSSLNRFASSTKHQSSASSNSKAKNVSTMLATNNIVFISLTLPIVVFLSITPSFREPNLCNHTRAKLRLVKIICIILMNTNYCINLFIYIFMSSQFRIQLTSLINQIFLCMDSKKSSSETTSKTTVKQSVIIKQQNILKTSSNNNNNNSDKIINDNHNCEKNDDTNDII